MAANGMKPKGGKREGSGRKPSEFLAECKRLASSPKFLSWAEGVLSGKPVEPKATLGGTVIKVEATVGDKVYLWEKLAAYGFGKPSQPIEVSGEVTGRICVIRAES